MPVLKSRRRKLALNITKPLAPMTAFPITQDSLRPTLKDRFMPKRTDIKSIMIIGAGPIVIGQACEFDYSGAQACKALREEGYRVILVNSNPATIVAGASLVVTDVWASMGQEEEQAKRLAEFTGFQVNAELMSYAASDALFMHCLPAHRGEEVSAELLDGESSVVWDEAENRMHSQKALIEFLLNS